MKYEKWTSGEVNLLEDLYPKFRLKDLVNKFPNRNPDTLVAKALSLGLPSAKIWHEDENKVLKSFFINSTREELSGLLPKRTWAAIIAQGERLGLKRKRNKPKLIVNEHYFKKWSSNMSYILGFILADGCIIQGTYKGYSDSVKFGVQVSDIDILQKIKKELGSEHKISLVKNAAHFSIASQTLVNDLKTLGIDYRKSLKETLPLVPSEYMRDFIRGIVDGDGGMSIDKKGAPVFRVCGGERVMTFLRDYFLNSMEVYSNVGVRTYSESQKNFLCEIVYKSTSALKIISYLYVGSCLSLDRKYKLALTCLKLRIKARKNFDGRKHI